MILPDPYHKAMLQRCKESLKKEQEPIIEQIDDNSYRVCFATAEIGSTLSALKHVKNLTGWKSVKSKHSEDGLSYIVTRFNDPKES